MEYISDVDDSSSSSVEMASQYLPPLKHSERNDQAQGDARSQTNSMQDASNLQSPAQGHQSLEPAANNPPQTPTMQSQVSANDESLTAIVKKYANRYGSHPKAPLTKSAYSAIVSAHPVLQNVQITEFSQKMIKHRYQEKLKTGKKPVPIKRPKKESNEPAHDDMYKYCWDQMMKQVLPYVTEHNAEYSDVVKEFFESQISNEENVLKVSNKFIKLEIKSYFNSFIATLDQPGATAETSKFITALDKIKALISVFKETELLKKIKGNSLAFATEFYEVLSEIKQVEYLSGLDQMNNPRELINMLMSTEYLGSLQQLDDKLIYIIMGQLQTRNFLLDIVEQQSFGLTSEQIRDKLNDKTDKSTLVRVFAMLIARFNVSALQAEKIVNQPQYLLFDGLLTKLPELQETNGCNLLDCLVEIKHDTQASPMIYLSSMWTVSCNQYWLWATVKQKLTTDRYSLAELELILARLPANDYTECKRALNLARDWLQDTKDKEAQKHKRGQIQDEKVQEKIDALCEQFKEKKHTLRYFDEILKISEELSKLPQSTYQHSPELCMYAAITISRTKRVVYLCLSTGRGKSWVCILMCLYELSKKRSAQIVTINDVLTDQYNDMLQRIGKAGCIDVVPQSTASCSENLQIFDEYFEALTRTKLTKEFNGSLPFVFRAGQSDRFVICTAHHTSSFEKFLGDLFGRDEIDTVHESKYQLHEKRPDDYLVVDGDQKPDVRILRDLAVQKIREKMNEMPLIVFGFDAQEAEMRKEFGNVAWFVNDAYTARQARREVLDKTSGIVFLSSKYRVGTDLKFSADAHVIIIDDERLDGETVLQMLGRGSRAHGKYYGSVFVIGHDGGFPQTKASYLLPTEVKFKEGATLIKMLLEVQKMRGKQAQEFFEIAIRAAERDWKINIQDVFNFFQNEKKKDLFDTLFKKVNKKVMM